MDREDAYIGQANAIQRVLQKQEDGAWKDLIESEQNAIVRVQALVAGVCVDTNVGSDPIAYASGVVEIKVGLVPGITAGLHEAQLTGYDASGDSKAFGEIEVMVRAWGC